MCKLLGIRGHWEPHRAPWTTSSKVILGTRELRSKENSLCHWTVRADWVCKSSLSWPQQGFPGKGKQPPGRGGQMQTNIYSEPTTYYAMWFIYLASFSPYKTLYNNNSKQLTSTSLHSTEGLLRAPPCPRVCTALILKNTIIFDILFLFYRPS